MKVSKVTTERLKIITCFKHWKKKKKRGRLRELNSHLLDHGVDHGTKMINQEIGGKKQVSKLARDIELPTRESERQTDQCFFLILRGTFVKKY